MTTTLRFVHTADWQLGMTRYFLSGEAQARYTAARIEAIDRIGELAVAERAEFVLVCGDVFESNAVSPQVVRRSLAAMGRIGVPVLLLPGNHDPLDAASVFHRKDFWVDRPANVTVLTAGLHRIRDGVEVLAAPWLSKRPVGDTVAQALEGVAPPAAGTVRVLAGHGAVDALAHHAGDPRLLDLARVERAVEAGHLHYLALGDRHSTTSVGRTGRVRYSGTPEVTSFAETDPGNVLLVTVDPAAVAVTPHRIGTWSFLELAVTLRGPDDLLDLRTRLAAVADPGRTVVRLGIEGSVTVAEHADLEDLLQAAGELFAGVHLRPDHAVRVIPVGSDVDGLGLSGYAAAAATELAATAAADPRAGAALSLLHRLTGAAR